MNAKAAVRERALALGFNDCRFTTAAPPEQAGKFTEWLAANHHGEMAYLQRNAHKRIDPRQVLPDAKSIITLAVSYAVPEAAPAKDSPGENASPPSDTHSAPSAPTAPAPSPWRGVVARYARYRDYHDVIGEKLKELTAFVDSLGAIETRSLWYIDTGPLLERELAQRAGLGFAGKHTNLISRQLGNWFFICEIITAAEFEPDSPEKNRCGTCSRCLTACPTQAITAPFTLDARRCISYLTIELKGPIPVELRPAIGARIYGCDDCLAACPWNRFAQTGRLMQEHALPDLTLPDLLELLKLDDAGFKQRFAGTPMLRTKRRGLLRNVCVALGNIADASAFPALEKAAQDHEPLVAEHARWAIDRIKLRTAASEEIGVRELEGLPKTISEERQSQ